MIEMMEFNYESWFVAKMRVLGYILDSFSRLKQNSPQNIQIYGVLETGEYVLLNRCHLNRSTTTHATNSQSVMTRRYRAMEMFVGIDLSNQDLIFDGISVSYTSMYTWLNPDPIQITLSDPNSEKITFTHTAPKYSKTILNEKFSLQIGYEYLMPSTHTKDFTISQNMGATLHSNEKLSLTQLQQKINYFRNFLMFATDATVQEISTKVILSDKNLVTIFSDHRTFDDIIDEYDSDKMNFLYTDIKDQYEDIISDWFRFYAQYEKPLDLYFRTKLEQPHLTYEIEFLRIMQSLEAFHKIKFPAEKDELKSCITHLRKNTNDLMDSSTYSDDFDTKVKNIRNYFVHGLLEKSGHDIPPNNERLMLMYKLDLLMFACVLKETKIPDILKTRIMTKKIKAVNAIKIL